MTNVTEHFLEPLIKESLAGTDLYAVRCKCGWRSAWYPQVEFVTRRANDHRLETGSDIQNRLTDADIRREARQ